MLFSHFNTLYIFKKNCGDITYYGGKCHKKILNANFKREFKNKFIVTERIKPVLTGKFTVFLHKDDFKVKGLPV